MPTLKNTLSAVAVAAGLATAALGVGAAVAIADPPPPDMSVGEVPPPNAPPKTAEFWDGEPVVWTHMWGGRWGVWKNGQFITLSSNINTGGG
ncbi:hypothetical protein CIW49_24930 [Mycolicibacterium sp. P1-18]|uniref:hypothetical protein n=1 Tax=Mycolicibacterium sp. P1-18 TaxID=2024615 RepID=UPI0011F169B4|nr:hypothetical protein [Mycolicibacterium sp. P1-18]KAA0094785.1 hypothetical protein CIW49_24930 [Mycolicibacterium sp. P1-18]